MPTDRWGVTGICHQHCAGKPAPIHIASKLSSTKQLLKGSYSPPLILLGCGDTQVSSRCLSQANNTHRFNPSPSARDVWAEIAGAARPYNHRETKMDTQRNQARHRCSGLPLKDHIPLGCRLPPSSACQGERNTTRGVSKVELVLPALPRARASPWGGTRRHLRTAPRAFLQQPRAGADTVKRKKKAHPGLTGGLVTIQMSVFAGEERNAGKPARL